MSFPSPKTILVLLGAFATAQLCLHAAEPIDYPSARQFWAFTPPANPALPEVADKAWPQNPIDHFILAKIESAGHKPSPQAEKRALVRRAYLDLHGLPPTTEQTLAFVDDPNPDAWPRLVEDLLASPRYGERWGRHWLDVARYADSNGMDEDIAHPDAFRYRDYVIASFNADKPFDQFIVEQLAGDLLPAGSLEQKRSQTAAAGFLSVGPKMLACDDPDKMRRDIVDEQIDTTGQAFLALTLGCARCHDHKFDPVSIADYYGLAGIFMSTKTLTKYSVVAEIHTHDLTTPEDAERHRQIAEHEKRSADKATPEEEKSRLAAEIAKLRENLPPPHRVLAPTEYPAQDLNIHLRGEYTSLGELVPRRLLPVIAGHDQPPMPKDQSGRLQLARWIASKENPLTARVIANRIWRWHFGRGIVPTPDNFGHLGSKPSHPDLLDHLAHSLTASNWSLKALHRSIMLSATYRQSSLADRGLLEADPDNALFARWQRRRTESEVVRDSILFKSNSLDLTQGGSLLVAEPNKYVDRGKLPEWAKSNRRTVYLPVLRSSGYDDQIAFDFPDPSVMTGDRRTSTVATQALFLSNSPLVHRASSDLANLLLSATQGRSPEDRTRWLILHLFGRSATEAEIARATSFIANYPESPEPEAWSAFARALFASNEFLYIE